MTGWRKRQVMEMAKEVKMPYDFVTGEPINLEKLEAFAELVRADERELCAKVCDDLTVPPYVTQGDASIWEVGTLDCAEAIRARGQA